MRRQGAFGRFAAGIAAASLLVGSAASAAPAAAADVDPLVALSLFGTASSQASLCAAGASSAAAAGAAAAQAAPGTPGCVLPMVDAPVAAPEPVAETPAYVPAAARGSIGVLPLLLGLAAIAGGLALLLSADEEVDIRLPISPN